MFPTKDDPDLMWVKMITFNLGLLLLIFTFVVFDSAAILVVVLMENVPFMFVPFHGRMTRRTCRVTNSKAENMYLHLRLRIVSVDIQMTDITKCKFGLVHRGGNMGMKERLAENIENSWTNL